MIEAAKERLAPFGDRIEYVVADLGKPLPLDQPVDAIVSTATFHWVPDHDALFANLAAVLPPGGRLVAQCGGFGNIDSIKRVLATIGDGWLGPAHYETPLATTAPARRRRVHRHRMLADRRTDPLRARRAAGDVPRNGRPRGAPRAASAVGACRVRPRGRVAAAGAADRLRPAQHPCPAVERVSDGGGVPLSAAGRPHGRMTMSDRRRMSVLPSPCRD